MCEPASITMGVIAVLSAGAAVYNANQQRHALEDQMKLQQEQTDQGAQAQTNDRLKQAREQRAAARAASAETGASGNSADAVLTDLLMQSGRDVSRIEKNRENGQLENQQQARNASAQINGQLVSGLAGSVGSGIEAGKAMRTDYQNYIPKIPDAGQHAPPTVTLDRQRYVIGSR